MSLWYCLLHSYIYCGEVDHAAITQTSGCVNPLLANSCQHNCAYNNLQLPLTYWLVYPLKTLIYRPTHSTSLPLPRHLELCPCPHRCICMYKCTPCMQTQSPHIFMHVFYKQLNLLIYQPLWLADYWGVQIRSKTNDYKVKDSPLPNTFCSFA